MIVLEPFGIENDLILFWNLYIILGVAVFAFAAYYLAIYFLNRNFPTLESIIKYVENKIKEIHNELSRKSSGNNETSIVKRKDKLEKKVSILSNLYLAIIRCYSTKWIFIFLVSLFLIWFSFVEIKVTKTLNLYDWFYLINPTDEFTLTLLEGILNTFKVLLPVSLPFYYFAFREQKNISDSDLTDRSINIYFLLFLLISLCAIGYIINVLDVFNSIRSEGSNSLKVTNEYAEDLSLIGIYILISQFFLLKCISKLFRNINIERLLKNKLKNTYLTYFLFTFLNVNPKRRGRTSKQSKTIYKYLSSQVETIYQLLIQASKKNHGKVYGENFKDLRVLLHDMLIDYRLGSLDNTTKHLYLLHKHEKRHTDFYKTILKNHKQLITTLVSNHKIEDAKDAINLLLELMPSPSEETGQESYDRYLAHYYVTLYEVISFLYDNEILSVHSILEEMNNESGSTESTEQEGILRNFQSLIIKATVSNDVKMLSSFSYYLSDFFQKNDEEINEAKVYLNNNENFTITEHIDEDEEDAKNGNTTDYLNGSIFIFLQALLKSIELTHYGTTGFLIKFLVTTYDSKMLNVVFLEFYKDPYDNKYLPKNRFYKDIDNDFHMNTKVKDYLLTKLIILLYSQQRYVIENQVNFLKVPEEPINISIILDSQKYLPYMFKKLEKAKNEYGLIFLGDEKFLKKIKKDFRVSDAKTVLENLILFYEKLNKQNDKR
ncbi:hypothetical protein VKA52_17480 [Halobacillus sp. HZG1]|uniref:hypothetical protein n=1 Tax=Halobacillus sp. HZG1 TaxID=3111769 RepID=UPI002DB73296|nr:hypothetical protein [Halobacillus sp. HZG1]MEC3885514.1 hypothetical protein [Halobacillus sp. HZG1]